MPSCLVVDDSRVIRKVARRILETCNFEVSEAENGEQAYAACQQSFPDAILLDWNMPVLDGLEFLKRLRQMPGGGAPKVVFCSTENDMDHIMGALNAGADEYIMKPFNRDILAEKFQAVGSMKIDTDDEPSS